MDEFCWILNMDENALIARGYKKSAAKYNKYS